MAWVQADKYSPASWHRLKGELLCGPWQHDWNPSFSRRGVKAEVQCSTGSITNEERQSKDGRSRYGGIRVKPAINLMQANICRYCKEKALNEDPELRAAADRLKAVA